MDRRSFLKSFLAVAAVVALPVTRTVKWARAKFVNVKWYGAVGDGITDDTEAVKAAFENVEEGGTVYFPAGEYRTAMSLSGVVRGDGRGTRIHYTGNGVAIDHSVKLTESD